MPSLWTDVRMPGTLCCRGSAGRDTYSVTQDQTLTVTCGNLAGVLDNDVEVQEDEPLTAVLVAGPAHGTLTLGDDGSFVYVPDAHFTGTDTFHYQAVDELGVA